MLVEFFSALFPPLPVPDWPSGQSATQMPLSGRQPAIQGPRSSGQPATQRPRSGRQSATQGRKSDRQSASPLIYVNPRKLGPAMCTWATGNQNSRKGQAIGNAKAAKRPAIGNQQLRSDRQLATQRRKIIGHWPKRTTNGTGIHTCLTAL